MKLTKTLSIRMHLCQLGIALCAAALTMATTGCLDAPPGDAAPSSDVTEQAVTAADAPPAGMVQLRAADVLAGRAGHVTRSTAAALPGGGSTAALFCTDSFALSAFNSGRFVTTMVPYTGGDYAMLRAWAGSPGAWEHYQVCLDSGSGLFALLSNATNRFVSAQVQYGGGDYAMLRAAVPSVGQWELFDIFSSDRTLSGILVFRSAANGLVVAAEFGYGGGDYGMLRARTSVNAVGPWEKFQLVNR